MLVKNGKVFLTYSASATDANYAMGMLTASAGAHLLDPLAWRMSPEPVFRSSAANGQYGPGHNSFTTTPDGETDVLVYHARNYRDIVGDSLHDVNRHTRARIWTIRTDGSQKTNVHKRTMAMEIAGHEWWRQDGKSIWYDWQYPKGEVFYVAGLSLETGKRSADNLQRDAWSIHFNSTRGEDLFAGAGADAGQVARAKDGEWIELFRPQKVMAGGAIDAPDYWHGGTFKSERLVNMAAHNYHLEPNVRFSPDKKLVVFRSNMFGAGYVLGVEVDKAAAGATDIRSTPELARQIKAAIGRARGPFCARADHLVYLARPLTRLSFWRRDAHRPGRRCYHVP